MVVDRIFIDVHYLVKKMFPSITAGKQFVPAAY